MTKILDQDTDLEYSQYDGGFYLQQCQHKEPFYTRGSQVFNTEDEAIRAYQDKLIKWTQWS